MIRLKAQIDTLSNVPISKWNLHEPILCKSLQTVSADGLCITAVLRDLISILGRDNNGRKRKFKVVSNQHEHMNKHIELMSKLPVTKWNLHEAILCEKLNIRRNNGISVRDSLSRLLSILKRGGIGEKAKAKFVMNKYGPMDLSDINVPNKFSIHYKTYGKKEDFVCSSRSEYYYTFQVPRYFTIGNSTVPVNAQVLFVRAITGTDPYLDKVTSDRRKETWLGWYFNNKQDHKKQHYSFEVNDLINIAKSFQHVLMCPVPDSFVAQNKSKELHDIRDQIKSALWSSNQIPSRMRHIGSFCNQTKKARDVCMISPDSVTMPTPSKMCTPMIPKEVFLTCTSTCRKCFPEELRATSLRCISDNKVVDKKLLELASIELVIHILKLEENSTWLHITNQFKKTGKTLPTTVNEEIFMDLSRTNISRVFQNVMKCRLELFDCMPLTIFQPNDNVLLTRWIQDGIAYTDGDMKVKPDNYKIHKDNEQLCLTDEAAHYMRHIIYCYKIPISKFPGLFNCFAILILRRELKIDEFTSVTALRPRLARLNIIDWHSFTQKFNMYISSEDQYGFKRMWYSTSDDSKHHKKDRHVLLMTAHEELTSQICDLPSPCFKLLTAGIAASKDSSGNADLNIGNMIQQLPGQVIEQYGGQITDNANDALDESNKTFDGIMKKIGESDQSEKINIYGIKRKVIRFGDPFHIDNLIVKHASIAAFGETKSGEHEEVHHRQLLQDLFDIHKKDEVGSQNHMNKVLEGSNNRLKIKVVRERIQRWLVNQRNAAWVILSMEVMTKDGTPALIEWAKRMHDYSDTWVRRCAGEVIVMLLMPEILLALNFEAELGEYFEVTMKWHAMPGMLSSRSGFRMFEIHSLWFEFIAPWWEKARLFPEIQFSKTYACLPNIKDPDLREKKWNQVLSGINAGYKELLKMSNLLLSPPIIFLVFLDNIRGASLLRAILAIMKQGGVELGKKELWGEYMYILPQIRPVQEEVFYNLLKSCGDDVVHWFQQVGFMRECVLMDLIKFSHEIPGTRNEGSNIFRDTYPAIFAALIAVFGLMPSNTRIDEQIHGRLRDSLKDRISIDFTDNQQKYMVNEEYHRREERRIIVRKRLKENETKEKAATSIKHDDSKYLQQMIGRQLALSGQKYSSDNIESILVSVQNNMKVRSLKIIGSLASDKLLATKKADAAEKKFARKTGAIISMTEWKKRATETKIGNDEDWKNLHDSQHIRNIEKVLNGAFWNGLSLKNGFKSSLETAMPLLWKLEYLTAPKSRIMKDVRAYIKMVKVMSKEISKYTGTSEISCAEVFVNVSNIILTNEFGENMKEKEQKVAHLFQFGGTTIKKESDINLMDYRNSKRTK